MGVFFFSLALYYNIWQPGPFTIPLGACLNNVNSESGQLSSNVNLSILKRKNVACQTKLLYICLWTDFFFFFFTFRSHALQKIEAAVNTNFIIKLRKTATGTFSSWSFSDKTLESLNVPSCSAWGDALMRGSLALSACSYERKLHWRE